MVKDKSTINTSEWDKVVGEYAEKLNLTSLEMIADSAARGSKALAQGVYPRGVTKKAQSKIEAAVKRDILRSYTNPYIIASTLESKHAMAKFFNTPQGQGSPFDQGAQHRTNRGSRGRVRYGKPQRILNTQGWHSLKTYISKKQKMAGYTKAGFASTTRQVYSKYPKIKAKRSPYQNWISRHTSISGLGTIKSKPTGSDKSISITNEVPWARGLTNDRMISSALKVAMRASMRAYRKQLNNNKV